jgi:pullulanase/glycogen debranching enzyme
MLQRIACYTIFNIEQTNITNRARQDNSIPDWVKKRNTQSNFDTLIQIISLRTQPENITKPKLIELNDNLIKKLGNKIVLMEPKIWYFTFENYHESVYHDGKTELGHLYHDCNGVPMIEVDRYYSPSNNFLDTTDELRNIFFEVLYNEK